MQSSSNLNTSLRQKHEHYVVPKVIGEWISSRYVSVSEGFPITNETAAQTRWGDNRNYPALFPVGEIIRPFRDPGICYSTMYNSFPTSFANAGDNKVFTTKIKSTWTEANRVDNRFYPRWYLAGKSNVFKYWISSARTLSGTDGNGRVAGEFSCTNQNSRALQVDVEFDSTVDTNKIQIKVNTHIATPDGVDVWAKKGGTWSQIATNITCPDSGVMSIYRTTIGTSGVGTWSTTPTYYTDTAQNYTPLQGIRLVVSKMKRVLPASGGTQAARNVSLEVLEFTPRLAIDLSSRVLDFDTAHELGNNSQSNLLLGTASSNTGAVTLSNNDGFFDKNGTNLLSGKLDENVEFTIDLTYSEVSGSPTIRQATMLSDTWKSNGYDEINLSLIDYSVILQTEKAQEAIYKNISATEAVWRLCDGIGFNRVDVKTNEGLEDFDDMDYFWTDGEKTVWEYIQELADSHQMSVFFNEFGRLQVMTRRYLYERTRQDGDAALTVDATLYGEASGANLSNIFDYSVAEAGTINKASITYKAVNERKFNRNRSNAGKNQIFWKQDSTYTLGAAEIVQSFAEGDTVIVLAKDEEDIPNYKGKFVIEDKGSRVFEYRAKQYQLANGSTRWVESDKEMAIAVEANNGSRPIFTGKIKLSRGAPYSLNSIIYDLRQNWNIQKFTEGSAKGEVNFSAVKWQKLSSGKDSGGALSITNPWGAAASTKLWPKGADYDIYDRVGIKFKIVNGENPHTGVVIFAQDNGQTGYHVSVSPGVNDNGYPEVRVLRTNSAGNSTALSKKLDDNYETPFVKKGEWMYVEAIITGDSNASAKDWKFNVYINGNFLGSWTDTGSNALARSQKAQFFVRGNGRVLIDKFYVINAGQDKSSERKSAYWSVKRKDLLYNRKATPGDKQFNRYKNQFDNKKQDSRVWVYNFNHAGWATAKQIIHLDVDFAMPALRQKIYSSNNNVTIARFDRRPMGASFTMKNHSERNQLMSGEKETSVAGAKHKESLFIYGRGFYLQEDQTVKYRDQELIRRRGPLAFDLNSQWIQRRESAVSIGKWLRDRFGADMQKLTVEVYGNPLYQPGDIVDIYWPGKVDSSLTFIVNSVSQNWENGLNTTLELVSRLSIPAKPHVMGDNSYQSDDMVPPEWYQISATSAN